LRQKMKPFMVDSRRELKTEVNSTSLISNSPAFCCCFRTFAQNCRNIEHLNLNGCTKITDSHHKQLFERFKLEDEALKHIQNHCHELAILNLQSCTQISDEGIVKICRGCHRLQSLCVSGCCNLTDASLTALGLNCPRLK
ncbi:hypothetical protein CIB84_008854, partial [Bambusicola thoracicus]